MGYQQILFNENGKIVQQKNIFHGYQSKIKVKINDKEKLIGKSIYNSSKEYLEKL